MLQDGEDKRQSQSPSGESSVRSFFRQLSISQQLFIYFALAIAILILVAWFNYGNQRVTLEKQADETALTEIRGVAQALDLFIQKCAARVGPIASHERTADSSGSQEMRRFLVDMLDSTPRDEAFDFFIAYEGLDSRDTNANLVVDRLSWPRTYGSTYDYHDPAKDWYHMPKVTGKPHLTEPYFDSGAVNQSMVSYSIPVCNSSNKFIGVTGVDILLDSLTNIVGCAELIPAPQAKGDQVVFVASKRGNLIAHPDARLLPGKDRVGENIRTLPEGPFMKPTPEGVVKAQIDGSARRIYWTTAPATHWVVVADVSEKALFAPIRHMTARMRNLSLLALLATLGVVVASVMHFTRPIRKLAQYAAGDTTQLTVINRADEIGQIGRSVKELVDYQAALDRANKDLESFAYSVSHDLRAPLRAISGYSSILLEDYEGKLDENGQHLCRMIQGSSKKMSQLIDDLLAFSRLNRMALEPCAIDMTELVRDVFYEVCPYEARSRVKFSLSTLPGANADPRLLRQAWVNLLSNAIKFSSKREMAEIHVHGKIVGEEVCYCVEDNGVGFDMRFSQKLFEVFQRLHSENEFPGTGVGLAIVHRVVTRHGGRVWAESVVDQGATFHFTLPIKRDEKTESEKS